MDPFPLFLILSSSVLHAGWNLLTLNHKSEAVYFERMLLLCVIIGFFPTAYSEWVTRSLTSQTYLLVLGSGICRGFYFYFLILSYDSSEFTIVYPVARALPVLMVGLIDVCRGRFPTVLGWSGMGLVVGGCFLIPLQSFRKFSWNYYFHKGSFLMFLTSLTTVGYTIIDKKALEIVKTGPGTAARYCYLFFLISTVVYCGLLRFTKNQKTQSEPVGWSIPFWGACMNFVSYWFVLWTFQLTAIASYTLAFRQFSSVVGVIAATVIYKEKGYPIRFFAVVIIVLGLYIISAFGK